MAQYLKQSDSSIPEASTVAIGCLEMRRVRGDAPKHARILVQGGPVSA
jgi:hypothetical protein